MVSASRSACVGCSCAPVAGVDDRAVDLAGEEMHGARRVVAHDDDVGPHGVQRRRGVDQGLALSTEEDATDMFMTSAPSRFARRVSKRLGAGRGLEEQVDLGAARAASPSSSRSAADLDGLVREVEQRRDVERRQPSMPRR
jgi:hypothetical protein